MTTTRGFDVVVVGAGISGIGAAIALRSRGYSFIVLERAETLGGTWRDNTYPGIAVDISSSSYCFPFETGFPWARTFATGAEVQRYVNWCADKYGVRADIRYRSRVVRCRFDEQRDSWTTTLADGTTLRSRFVISATGLFGAPKFPDIAGLDTFSGTLFHTARWKHDHDLRSRRVAVIGTGASAVQIVPEIARLAGELEVFQRTPIWISPRPDRPRTTGMSGALCRHPGVRKLQRFLSEAQLEFLTFAVVNYRAFPFIVDVVQWYLERWMRRQVADPDTAARLVPTYPLGCKRPTISNDYLPSFNRSNVRLVTSAICRATPAGIVTADGRLHEADTIVLATGFLTTEEGNAPTFTVVGRDGLELGRFWAAQRRQAYAGVSVPGFPNFFLAAGPYSGGFNWFTALDANLRHIVACLEEARTRRATRVSVTERAHAEYMRDMSRRAAGTVFMDEGCAPARSYYLDQYGDASLALPYTPRWRRARARRSGTRGYAFETRDVAAVAQRELA